MSATLKLYYWTYSYDPVGRTYQAYQVTQSWTESGVTWNKYDGASSWATAGGDYTPTGGASATVPSSYDWMTWDVTDIVKAWVSGQPNYGFLIKDNAESDNNLKSAYFYSREAFNARLRPTLEVTYEMPTQVIPEVPFGVAMAVSSMLVAFVGFLGFKRFRPKFRQ